LRKLGQPVSGDTTHRSPTLSVIIPAFNEAQTIRQVVEAVKELPIDTEIIVVNDGSTDDKSVILEQMRDELKLKILQCKENRGKGSAIRLGLEQVTGQFVVIQDADLELCPRDLTPIIEALQKGIAKVVYGSRFLNGKKQASLKTYIANRMLASFTNLLYHVRITDEATCYKAFRLEVVQSLDLRENRFGIDMEITAKVAAGGWRIWETGISYTSRNYAEGKKITWKDGIAAFVCICRYAVSERVRRIGGNA